MEAYGNMAVPFRRENQLEHHPHIPDKTVAGAFIIAGGISDGLSFGCAQFFCSRNVRGRRSGTVRKSPLIRVRHGAEYAVVASMGGAPDHPVWFLNLEADPLVSLQDGPDLRDYTARVADAEEKAQWWPRCTEVWPAYDDYQASTERDIPVVIVTPR